MGIPAAEAYLNAFLLGRLVSLMVGRYEMDWKVTGLGWAAWVAGLRYGEGCESVGEW